jgi:hypothetical protein
MSPSIRIDALEHNQLRASGRRAREQLLQALKIVVASDLPGTASGGLQVREDPIAALTVQSNNGRLKAPDFLGIRY